MDSRRMLILRFFLVLAGRFGEKGRQYSGLRNGGFQGGVLSIASAPSSLSLSLSLAEWLQA